MDADAVVKFEALLGAVDERDLATLQTMQEILAGHVFMAEAARRGGMLASGWKLNAPGLRCDVCGGLTWGKEIDGRDRKLELVKCADSGCRAMRTIVIG